MNFYTPVNQEYTYKGEESVKLHYSCPQMLFSKYKAHLSGFISGGGQGGAFAPPRIHFAPP